MRSPRHTILVVDDQADEREAMADLLRRRQYGVESVGNGQEAIDHLRRGATLPSLIILDLNMPVMDGWEFLFRAAQDPALRDVPVLVMSGSPVVQDAPLVPANVTFVAKPVRPRVVLDVIAHMLRGAPRTRATTARVCVVTPVEEMDTERYVIATPGQAGAGVD